MGEKQGKEITFMLSNATGRQEREKLIRMIVLVFIFAFREETLYILYDNLDNENKN